MAVLEQILCMVHILSRKYVCMFLELYNSKKIKKIYIKQCCFHESLCDGTILYGTLIENRFFYIEKFYSILI